MERKRILIVQHDPMTRQIMQVALDTGEQQCVVARSGAEALALFTKRDTALVLLDAQLPDIDGFALLHALRGRAYSGPVIFVSRSSELETKLLAFRYGADDYLSIPFDPIELTMRVEAVLRRYRLADRAVTEAYIRVNDAELNLSTLTYFSDVIAPTLLGPTEIRLLEYLMRNAHVPVRHAALGRHVWDDGHDRGQLVDATIRRLRHKIELEPTRPHYLHTVRGVGYMFQPVTDIGGCVSLSRDRDCDDA